MLPADGGTASIRKLMSLPIPLLLAVLGGLSPSAQAMAPRPLGTTSAIHEASISTAQLRAYAAVVVAVAKIRSSFATQSAALLPADRVAIQGELDEQIRRAFTSHDLSRGRFDAIASAIENNPVLHRQVYQFEMDNLMGT